MATESSAVVRFINLAQQSQNPVLPTQPPPAPITSEFGTEVLREVRSRPSRAPLIVGAIALAGGAAAGGIYLGKSGFGGPDGPDKTSAPAAAATPVAAVERADTQPAAPVQPAPIATPQVTSPVVTVPPDVLAATGFDIRVEPSASITLDGSLLGKAPLRVRNLQAGAHVLDIEAPAGYFSRRMEVTLAAGESQELKLALDPIDEAPAVAAATADDPRGARPRRSRAELRRERKEKAREEQARKKQMKATRVAAAKAAKARGNKPGVVAEPLPEPESKPARTEKQSDADAELDAAMAEIVGKPSSGSKKSAASAAGASSLSASPAPSISSGKGTLMLGSKPLCDIILDGKPTGLKTPQRAMELAPGTHSVVLVNAELGIEKKFKVKIAPGKTTKAIQDLTKRD